MLPGMKRLIQDVPLAVEDSIETDVLLNLRHSKAAPDSRRAPLFSTGGEESLFDSGSVPSRSLVVVDGLRICVGRFGLVALQNLQLLLRREG